MLLNYLLCRLPLIIFHYTKIEVFEWPSKRKWPCKTNEMHKLLPALYYMGGMYVLILIQVELGISYLKMCSNCLPTICHLLAIYYKGADSWG